LVKRHFGEFHFSKSGKNERPNPDHGHDSPDPFMQVPAVYTILRQKRHAQAYHDGWQSKLHFESLLNEKCFSD